MQFSLFIAWRYFKAKKSHNIINIISWISMIAIAFGTAALIVVLSVFNGFEDLVSSLFNTFDPDIKIESVEGKTFFSNTLDLEAIKALPGVISLTEVIEENALLKHGEQQYIATLKGVSNDFLTNNPIDSMIIAGTMKFPGKKNAVAGYGICYFLGINIHEIPEKISVYVPQRHAKNFGVLDNAFNIDEITVTGVFSIQQDFDTKYVIVPIDLMKGLMEYEDELTAVEIRLAPGVDLKQIHREIAQLTTEQFSVKSRFQQQESLYKVMRSEKLAIFLILTFILIIAAFNMIGSQSMLILDKKKDSAVLWSMGADNRMIKRIFLTQGILIAMIGAVSGLILGGIMCLIQIQFGIIQFDTGSTFVISAYPVLMKFTDFVVVFITVSIIGFGAAFLPSYRINEHFLSLTDKSTH